MSEFWRHFWAREVDLVEGHFYILRPSESGEEELPSVALFKGWSNDVPVFEFIGDPPAVTRVAILGETRDPYRDADPGDPQPS